MFKLIVLLKKKTDFTDEQFTTYWLETHALLAKKMPGLRRYVANVVMPPPNKAPDYNGVVELWFDNVTDMKNAFSSPEGQATQKDTETFTTSRTTMYIDEHSIV